MGIRRFFGHVGGFFKKVFSGLTGIFIHDFHDVAEQIVKLLLFAAVPGSDKFNIAMAVLKGYAIKEGKTFINHAARLLIQLQLTEAQGGNLEKIIDEGMELALVAVNAVNAMDLFDDDERRNAAVAKLKDSLVAAGKAWLTNTSTLHVLVELAVDELLRLKKAA